MAIVVKGACCSLSEAVVDRLLSWDIDVIASEDSHAVRNSTLLKLSSVKLSKAGEGFSISFDGSPADIVVGVDLIIHDLLPSRADRWLAPEIQSWLNGEQIDAGPRYWLCVLDAAEAITHILKFRKKVGSIHMCGRREWLSEDTFTEFKLLLQRTQQGQSGQFTKETLFNHSLSGMNVKPIIEKDNQRPDLEPLHNLLLELTGDGWRPLIPFRTGLMNLIAGLRQPQ
ncbi:MAG: hypothetical protein ACKVIR_04200 [Candidatus Poseidoniales archaeon]|jgi:hypothetical protein